MSPDFTLKEIRARFGLRQHELAAWLGLSRSQYSQVEADWLLASLLASLLTSLLAGGEGAG